MTHLNRFENRIQAGELLAQRLMTYAGRADVIVLALPRGGVPVGFSVAKILMAPLDILSVRKLGVPGHEEYAMGAIANGGLCVLQHDVLEALEIPTPVVETMAQTALLEIARREQVYRGNRPSPQVNGRIVILVDDGMATGSSMLVAIKALRSEQPAHIVAAIPVAAPETCRKLADEVDEIICLITPDPFYAVGSWYEDFSQVSDEEVRQLLDTAERAHNGISPHAITQSGEQDFRRRLGQRTT